MGRGLDRSAKLRAAATILIVGGLVETGLLVYAFLHKISFGGGVLFYVYVGYKLLKRDAKVYKYTTRGLLAGLGLVAAAFTCLIVLGADLALTQGLSLELEAGGFAWIAAVYLVVIPILAFLLYHPDTRSEFGLPEVGRSQWTLYLGGRRLSAVSAIGMALAAFLLGPYLVTNPLRIVADAVQNDASVKKEIGSVQSLGLLSVGETNWTLMTEVRASGSEGTGFYYVDLDPDGAVKIDAYGYEGLRRDAIYIPRAQEEPAVPEAFADASAPWDVVTLLSTSFETSAGGNDASMRPLVQTGQLPWGRDHRAHSGRSAANVIPEGNPGTLAYFSKSMSARLLNSRPGERYAPFRVEQFRRVALEFWRLPRSNPSTWHKCLGSLRVENRFDGGDGQAAIVYCGQHKSAPPEWKRCLLELDTKGRRELEIRFDYEYPPELRKDKTAVYLIDDLQVHGYR